MIDHLVIATPDVAATTSALTDEWGIDVTPGGSHVGRGTRNALTGLGGATYLEVIGPDEMQPVPDGPRPFGIDDLATHRLAAWCVRPERRLDDVVTAVAAFGVDLGGIEGMTRRRPDGLLLRWRLTLPLVDAPYHGAVPFLIDWMDSPHPAASVPQEAQLLAVHITHPDADLVRGVIAEVGSASIVEVVKGPVSLSAVVRTPRGIVTI